MLTSVPGLMGEIRGRFAHVDRCPEQGERIFFENAGGALTLKSVVERSAEFAAIPDNQGRNNPAAHHGAATIAQSKEDIRAFLNAPKGQVFVGESGTELLFRLIRTACLGTPEGGEVVGSTVEHPASRSACVRWAEIARKSYVSVPHNNETGTVTTEDYLPHISADTRVATILHTSPVSGINVDVAAIAAAIRNVSPACIIIVDGIQHAAHGGVDIDSYNIDGYVISPYKVFSRHGYGIAWISDRLAAMPHDHLIDAPGEPWELGTRDAGSYATFSEVVDYLEWLGSRVSNAIEKRPRIEAAGRAMAVQEAELVEVMINGKGNLKGLKAMQGVIFVGGADNKDRKGLVSVAFEDRDSEEIIAKLSKRGIRVHIRKADHYSGQILRPLGLEHCIRISLCHYNSEEEVLKFLKAMAEII
ncbi:MAG: aminotransferase class V-fold PLP-dependent enzyme [Rhizobiaceae bacterium]